MYVIGYDPRLRGEGRASALRALLPAYGLGPQGTGRGRVPTRAGRRPVGQSYRSRSRQRAQLPALSRDRGGGRGGRAGTAVAGGCNEERDRRARGREGDRGRVGPAPGGG